MIFSPLSLLPPPPPLSLPPSPLSPPTVDDGAILDVQFSDFFYPPPDGFDRIMFEKNIL